MSKVETVSVGTTQSLAEVRATLERVFGAQFEQGTLLIGGGVSLLVEEDEIVPGFQFEVDVYDRAKSAEQAVQMVRDRLAEETPWRLATEFDDDDNPVDERPALSATA